MATKLKKEITMKSKSNRFKSAHEYLKLVLIVALVIGLLPVQGITEKDVRHLEFHWMSFRVLYCLANIVGIGFQTCAYVFFVGYTGLQFYGLVSIAFFGFSCTVTVLLFKLAREWPSLMQQWEALEYPVVRMFGKAKHLETRLLVIVLVVTTLAVVEHTLFLYKALYVAQTCAKAKNKSALEDLLLSNHEHIFRFVPFAIWKGMILQVISKEVQIINLMATFAWNYMDLFIMVISTILATRFQQINLKLQEDTSPILKREEYWRNIRNAYTKLYCLCKIIDRSLSPLVLVSFAINLFIMLAQLFNTLMPMGGMLEKVYFTYSFAFLIARTVSVAMHAAWIHDEGMKPILILNTVPSASYSEEIKRFLEQISSDPVALTGLKFFTITRRLVLSIAGAIVTYELILINFNSSMLEDLHESANSTNNSNC